MRAPFTLLTGFLGAGKTTALNRLLAGVATSGSGKRVAVLVNELGRVAIDNRLIVGASGDVIELAGGCLCCKLDMRSDLWGGIVDIIERSRPDHVVLETTGIAEPPAILDGLEHFKVREWVEPAGVVCVIDAANGGEVLDSRQEAKTQLECADRVLLTKLDIADMTSTDTAHRRIAALNDDAERAGFPDSTAGNIALADWVCEKRKLRRGRKAHHHAHAHSQISSASFVDDEPLASEALLSMVRELAPTLLRVKGFVNVAGEERRGQLDLAGGRITLELKEQWGPAESRRSELVFIGEGIGENELRRRLWSCRAGRTS